jgi:hypothetical protein
LVLSSEDAVALYSAAIEMPVELIGPLAGGETGAMQFASPTETGKF